MSVVESEFRPRWWLRNPHLQTVLASKLARPPVVATRAERFELDDGDFLDLAHGPDPARAPACSAAPDFSRAEGDVRGGVDANNAGDATAKPMVAMFHGLAGSVASPYIQGAIRQLANRGFRTVLMHWRGCSGEPNRLRRSYHSGASDDIGLFIDELARRFPTSPLFAVGYSLGGNALLKYLGEQGDRTPLSAALAVCPPLVLSVGATQLDQGVARVYKRHLLDAMKAQHEAKRARYPALDLPPAHDGLNSFWQFDDELTAPLHGYDGVDDYYERCSARRFLADIRVPTHILSARDDPFFTESILPAADELATGTTLELSRHGGHVGFLGEGSGLSPDRWLDNHVARIIEAQAGQLVR